MHKHFQFVIKPHIRLGFHPGIAIAYIFTVGAAFVHVWPAMLMLPCPWKTFAGIPCPSCGAGRCVSALLRWRVLEAIAYNPLFFFALLLGMLAIIAWLLQLTIGKRVHIRLSSPGLTFTRRSALAAIAANYAYLLYHGI